jgi:Rrf2 family protein
LFAIAAVIDVALHASKRPVSAKAIAARYGLPLRHLEPVLQALVHDGILRGLRGPHGGYALGRERRSISVEDILRAAGNVRQNDDPELQRSGMVGDVVLPAVAEAEHAFACALVRISVEELTRRAEAIGISGDDECGL